MMFLMCSFVLSFILSSLGYATSLGSVVGLKVSSLWNNETATPSSGVRPASFYTQPFLTAPAACTAGCRIEVNAAQIVWAPNTTYTFRTEAHVVKTVETTIYRTSPVAALKQIGYTGPGTYTNRTEFAIPSQTGASTNTSVPSNNPIRLLATLSGMLSLSNTDPPENSNYILATETSFVTSLKTLVPSITAIVPSAATKTTIFFDYLAAGGNTNYQASTTVAGFPMTYPTPYVYFTDFTVSCASSSTIYKLPQAYGYQYTGNAMADFAGKSSVNGPLPASFMKTGKAASNASLLGPWNSTSNTLMSTQTSTCALGYYHGTPTLQLLLGTYGVPKFVIHHPLALLSVLPGENSRPPQPGLNIDVGMSTAQSVASTAGSASTTSYSQLTTDHEAQAVPLTSVAAPSPQTSAPSQSAVERFSMLPSQKITYSAIVSTATYGSSQAKQSKYVNQQTPQAVATTVIAVAPMQAVTAKPASDAADHAPFQTVNLQTTNVNLLVTSKNDVGSIVTATTTSDILFQGAANPTLSLSQALASEGGVLVPPLVVVTDHSASSARGKPFAMISQATSTDEAGSIVMLPSTIFVTPLPFDRPSSVPLMQTATVVQNIVKTYPGGSLSTGLSTSEYVYQVPVASDTRAMPVEISGASTTGIVVPFTSKDSLGSKHITSSTSNLVYLPFQSVVSYGQSTNSMAQNIPQGALSSDVIIAIISIGSRGSTMLSSSTSPILVLPQSSGKLDAPGRLQFGSQTVRIFSSPTGSPTVVNIAGQTVAVNPSGFQIDGHSIVPGAQGVTISGTPISLGMSGQLQVGSQTIALATATPYSTKGILVSVTLTDSAGRTYTTASTSDLVYESVLKAGDAIPPGAYTTALVEGIVTTDAKGSVYTSSITTSVLAIPTGVANPPNPISGSILVPLTTEDSSGHTYTTASTSNLVLEPLPTPGASTPSNAFTTLITEAVVRTDVSGQVYTSSLTTSVLALPTGDSGNSSSSGIGGAIVSGLTPSSAGFRVGVNSWVSLISMTVVTGFGTLLVWL